MRNINATITQPPHNLTAIKTNSPSTAKCQSLKVYERFQIIPEDLIKHKLNLNKVIPRKSPIIQAKIISINANVVDKISKNNPRVIVRPSEKNLKQLEIQDQSSLYDAREINTKIPKKLLKCLIHDVYEEIKVPKAPEGEFKEEKSLKIRVESILLPSQRVDSKTLKNDLKSHTDDSLRTSPSINPHLPSFLSKLSPDLKSVKQKSVSLLQNVYDKDDVSVKSNDSIIQIEITSPEKTKASCSTRIQFLKEMLQTSIVNTTKSLSPSKKTSNYSPDPSVKRKLATTRNFPNRKFTKHQNIFWENVTKSKTENRIGKFKNTLLESKPKLTNFDVKMFKFSNNRNNEEQKLNSKRFMQNLDEIIDNRKGEFV